MSIEHLSICILNLWYNKNWSMLILFLPEIESWTQQTSLRMRTVWCSGRLPEGKQRPMLQWQAEGQNSWLQIRMHWSSSISSLVWVLSEIDQQNIYSHPQLVTTSVLSKKHCHFSSRALKCKSWFCGYAGSLDSSMSQPRSMSEAAKRWLIRAQPKIVPREQWRFLVAENPWRII